MQENAGVDGAGEFASEAHDDAEGENGDADIPLAMKNRKNKWDDENGNDNCGFLA